MRKITETELRARLAGQMSEEAIGNALDRLVRSRSNEIPDTKAVSKLASRAQDNARLKVSFTLTQDQFDALASYFDDESKTGTQLSQNAIEEFISIQAS